MAEGVAGLLLPQAALLWALVIAAGLSFGSFVTLASYRWAREETSERSIVRPPSRCPVCFTTLGWRALIPVMSWVVQRGKCRYCGTAIHARYPLIELTTAAGFLGVFALYGVSITTLLLWLLVVGLMILIVADFEHFIIPDEVHLLLLPLAVPYRILQEVPLPELLFGPLAGLAIGLALRYGYRAARGHEGLGLGDVKFLGVAGAWLGALHLVPFLFFAGLFGIATALVWRVLGRGAVFPFGPALAMSLLLCVLFPALPNGFWQIGALLH